MSSLDDEFRFLAGDARRVGRAAPLPAVRRVEAEVADGRRVRALAFDPHRAPELVFLHGIGLNAHSFDPTVLALGAPALSVDLPGHGRSDWRPDARYTPTHLAPDVTAALGALAPRPVTLVGHSLGGLTAAAVAGARAGVIRQLVLVDITPGHVPAAPSGAVAEFIGGQRDFASHEEMVDRAIAFGIGHDRERLARGVALNSRRRADGRWEWAHHLAHLPNVTAAATGEAGEGTDTGTDGAAGAGAAALPTATAPERAFADLWSSLERLHADGVALTLVAASAGFVDSAQLEEWRDRLPRSTVDVVEGPHNLHEAAPRELATVLARAQARAAESG